MRACLRRRAGRLPYDLMAQIGADAVELVAVGRWLEVMPFLEFLELKYGENPAVDNVIDVGLLKRLPRGHEIVDLLGPELRAAHRRTHPPAGQGEGNR